MFLFAIVCGLIYLKEPGLGDDLHYWRLATGFHTDQGVAWGEGFHNLRWPVWGVIWLLQYPFGQGLASYYGEPILYLAAGTLMLFLAGRLLFQSDRAAWCCGLLFLFHPLLDPSITRPMPDLSEGIWSAAAFLCWWKAMQPIPASRKWLFSLLTGLAIAVGYANRITGSFVIVALIAGTLVCYRREFRWLVLCGVFTLLFIGIECTIYWSITGDFLHSLHSNLGARGRKGTEAIPLYRLPFRFVDVLWDGNFLNFLYNTLALAGAVVLWRTGRAMSRAVVVWGASIYLCYSMGVQSFDPPRPLVRDGARFIAALAAPLTLMTAAALIALVTWFSAKVSEKWRRPFARHPAIVGVVAVALLLLLNKRERYDLGFVSPLRAYLKEIPEGSKIFAEGATADLAYFISSNSLKRLNWEKAREVLFSNPRAEAGASRADYIAFNRKSIWVSQRKQLEREEVSQQPKVAVYIRHPFPAWKIDFVVPKNNNRSPDLTFFRKREPGEEAPIKVRYDDPTFSALLQHATLPDIWDVRKFAGKEIKFDPVPIPKSWRGRMVRLEVIGSANTVQAVTFRIEFEMENGGEYLLKIKPYLYPKTGFDFYHFQIPYLARNASVSFSFERAAREVRIQEINLYFDGMGYLKYNHFKPNRGDGGLEEDEA